jgi:hypothetical protein
LGWIFIIGEKEMKWNKHPAWEATKNWYNDFTVFVDAVISEDGTMQVHLTQDNGLMHMSISRTDRYPTWDEIKEARYDLIKDDCYMVMVLPPKSQYVNLHNNCFHLHELSSAGAKQFLE